MHEARTCLVNSRNPRFLKIQWADLEVARDQTVELVADDQAAGRSALTPKVFTSANGVAICFPIQRYRMQSELVRRSIRSLRCVSPSMDSVVRRNLLR